MTVDTVRRIVGPTILLHSGNYFDYEAPEKSAFDIVDIARGLSHICRFAGQCGRFYSVAEHSVFVSQIVAPEHAFAGLMHDASEAFVGDMAKPLKVMCPDYVAIEKRVERAVLDRFGLALPLHPSIKEADIVMLATEQAQIMHNRDDWEYTRGRQMADITIQCLAPDEAMRLFLRRYEELTGQRVVPAEPAGEEPVGYLCEPYICTREGGEDLYGVRRFSTYHPRSTDRNITPLYARPATPTNPERLVGWRPIDSAPKDGTEIILFGLYPENDEGLPTNRVTAGFWLEPEAPTIRHRGGECRCPEYGEAVPAHWCMMHGGSSSGWMSTDGGFTTEWPPTHWMPLPAAPLKGEGE